MDETMKLCLADLVLADPALLRSVMEAMKLSLAEKRFDIQRMSESAAELEEMISRVKEESKNV